MKIISKFAAGCVAVLALSLNLSTAKAADIVDTAASKPEFSILVKMIKQAGLEETLRGKGPFTVFAPTDEAFKKWPKAELDLFLNPAKKQHLVRLLKTHVVPGTVMSSDLAGKKTEAKNADGTMVMVDAMKDVMVEKGKVVMADIKADNGIIHVIDTPILPKAYRGSF